MVILAEAFASVDIVVLAVASRKAAIVALVAALP
jgi:hypothetical protein